MSFYNKDDNISWKKGEQYYDGSTILMVERMDVRALEAATCGDRCDLCCCGVFCPWFLP